LICKKRENWSICSSMHLSVPLSPSLDRCHSSDVQFETVDPAWKEVMNIQWLYISWTEHAVSSKFIE
jgi:hypothetical protein